MLAYCLFFQHNSAYTAFQQVNIGVSLKALRLLFFFFLGLSKMNFN